MDHNTKSKENGFQQSSIYSSLIQTARPVASLAARLRILPYSYNVIYDRDFLNTHYNEEENMRLLDVWRKGEYTETGYISLHIISQKDDETKISQIGMSKWRSDGSTDPISVHCQVERETTESESSSIRLIAGDFIFGDTEVITESDIGPWLDATFKSFQVHQNITCLVGHDIRHILHLVKSDWEAPSDVIILDTRAIWESQTNATQHPSFKKSLGVVGYGRDDFVFNNAGNNARFILDLVQSLSFQAKRTARPQDPEFDRQHEHRRNIHQHAQVTPASWSSM